MELQTYLTFQLHGEMALHCSVRYQFYLIKHDRTIFHCRRKIQIAYLPKSATLTKLKRKHFPAWKRALVSRMAVDRKGTFLQKSVHQIINVLVKANYYSRWESDLHNQSRGYNDWSTFL